MAKILTRYSNNKNTQLNTNSFINKLNQKISILGGKIFSYLHRNQHAFAAGIWCYLFIEVGLVACQMTFGEEYIKDVSSCQKILCDYWSDNNETLGVFPPIIAFRCNFSTYSQDFLPSYSFETCMNDLCEYMGSIGKQIYGCNTIFNQKSTEKKFDSPSQGKPYSSKLVHELWEQICPNKEFENKAINEKGFYLNSCLEKLCTDSFRLNIKLDHTLINWCQNINVDKLYKLLSNLTQIVHDSKEKSQDSDTWMKANVIASLIASLTAVTLTIATLIGTMAAMKAPSNALVSNLKNLVNSASQTAETIVEMSSLSQNEIIPKDTLHTLSQITDSMSYYSAHSIENLPMDPPEINIIPSEEEIIVDNLGVNALGTKSEVAIAGVAAILGSLGVVGYEKSDRGSGAIEDEGMSETSKTIHLIHNVVRSTLFMGKVDTTTEPITYTQQKATSPERVDEINMNQIFQQYLDDYIVNYINVQDIILKQASRLKNSLADWQNAFCFYTFPNGLACKFPESKSHSLIRIPMEKLKKMVSEDPIGLCYVFDQQLWCNWDKFLNIVSYTRSMSINVLNCYWDQLFLTVKKTAENSYQLNFQGASSSCYNETTVIRI